MLYVFFLFQALNLILLTSSELYELRDLLKQSLVNPAGKDLFVSLYASWCHSPMAIISLCLLAQVRIWNIVMAVHCIFATLSFIKPRTYFCGYLWNPHDDVAFLFGRHTIMQVL